MISTSILVIRMDLLKSSVTVLKRTCVVKVTAFRLQRYRDSKLGSLAVIKTTLVVPAY